MKDTFHVRDAIAVVVLASMAAGCNPTFCLGCRHITYAQEKAGIVTKEEKGQTELDRIYKSLEDVENGNAEKAR